MDYKSKVFRIIDANINRAKEGARVCEDIMRLVIEDKNNTLKLKKSKACYLPYFQIIQNQTNRYYPT